ncbi:hypothetical protein ANFP_18570 [Acidithiobacillus ferrooxidans]|jgi:hypothetical protein|nr:hypothetical protein ANFP_18570 [Acidithiobacillus ferrooxidans]
MDGYVPVALENPNATLPDQSFDFLAVLANAHVNDGIPVIKMRAILTIMRAR